MHIDDLVIRAATDEDATAVADVHLASRKAAPMPPSVHPDEDAYPWLAARVREDEVWVAEADARVVGYVRLTATWLDDLYVLPDHAGQGVGSALLDLAKARRPEGFCLWVFEDNRPARRFYGRHGLVELERTDGSANEEGAPDLRMAWPGARPLEFFRSLIDEVDEQLGGLLARRAALTRAVQPHKTVPGRDPGRERAIAEAMARRAPELGADRLTRIVHTIITESLAAAQSR